MKVGTIDSYVAATLKLISPKLARYYLIHETERKLLNFSILYFVTYWATVPMTVAFAFSLGATPLAWVLSGFFIGAIVAGVRFMFSHYWVWAQGKEQGTSRGVEPTFTSPTVTGVEQSRTPAPPNDDKSLNSSQIPITPMSSGKILTCPACNGQGVVNDTLCTRCRGHGQIRIVPRGPVPTIGGKSSGYKFTNKELQLLSIVVGILIAALGSRIPMVGSYIALGGIGIIVMGLFMFKSTPKKVATDVKS